MPFRRRRRGELHEPCAEAIPEKRVARLLEIRTFISYPVFTAEGRFFGTLCGASKEQVEIEQEVLDLMRECARLIGRLLRDAER